jgi:hypothetical protein
MCRVRPAAAARLSRVYHDRHDLAVTEERAEMLMGQIHELTIDIPGRSHEGIGDVESA